MEFQLTDLIDGQYKVTEKHRGGMSIVYVVLDSFSQKRFAIKTVKEDFLSDRSVVDRFCEEAKTWMNIGRHTHVVEAIIYRDIQAQPFLWLEYVDGNDMQRLLDAEGRLFPPQVVEYALQVCDAMSYVHVAQVRGQRGVIHRDLKPANIMLDRRLGVKITDFGLAKVFGHSKALTDAGRGLGTYLYMPPEQFLDATTADAASDIYSFGACLYATLTSHPPASGDNVGAIINSILSRVPPTPASLAPDVPEALSAIVMKCLAKRRDDRYPSFAALGHALRLAEPQIAEAVAEREVRRCTGCGYTTLHVHRLCPVCSSGFVRGEYAVDLRARALAAEEALLEIPADIDGATAEGAGVQPPGVPTPDSSPGASGSQPQATEIDELLTQANTQYGAGRIGQAIAVLRDALDRDPSRQDARALLDQWALEMARTRPVAPSRSYNWSMFRGNITRNGFSPEVVLPPLNRRWRTKVGQWVISSPAVVNGVVYVGASIDVPGRRGLVAALRARDGGVIWTTELAYEVIGSPAVLDGKVLFVGSQNSMLALDCATGQRLWEHSTAGSVVCGPAAWKTAVYFGSCDGRVYAVDAHTGNQLWAFRTQGEVFSSPALWNGVVYVGSTDHRLYALNANSGRPLWEFLAAGEIVCAPAYADDRVFVGATDNRVYCIDAAGGQRIWEYQTEGQVHSSPAVHGTALYVGSRDRSVYALDARTGAQKWSTPTGDWVHSSPVLSGNVVYCGSHDGKLYAIEAELGVPLWEAETEGEIQSSPALSGGALFIGSSDGHLYCFTPR